MFGDVISHIIRKRAAKKIKTFSETFDKQKNEFKSVFFSSPKTLRQVILKLLANNATLLLDICEKAGQEKGYFSCENGNCVAYYEKCDGDDDCGDLSDEENCPGKKDSFNT